MSACVEPDSWHSWRAPSRRLARFGVAAFAPGWLAEPKRRRLVGSGENRTSCRKGTAFTAQRRHQPSLLALPESRCACPNCRPSFRPSSPFGLRRDKFRRAAAKFGGELRVRTSVLADPSVFGTDCRPLQRSSP